MDILASAPAGGNSGPGSCALRTEQAEPFPIPSSEPIGYGFDPIPSAIRRDPRLKAIDHHVLAILISFAVWRRDSCWTTMKIIATRLPAIRPGRSGKAVACERTAQRSIDRLKATGYIRHERVAKPDPDQPGNWTGWRFFFNFVPVQVAPIEPRREVTKEPREVTKGSPGVPGGGGEVTKESGDSIVTQVRGDFEELDPITSDAVAFASGKGEPPTMPTEPVATVEAPPAVPAPAIPDRSRMIAAHRIVRQLMGRDASGQFRDLRPRVGDDLSIVWTVPPGGGPAPSPTELAEIERFKPEVLQELSSRRVAVPRPPSSASPKIEGKGKSPAAPPAAPKVANAAQKRVREAISGLSSDGGPAGDLAVGREIGQAIGDMKPESIETFTGYARDVRAGRFPMGELLGAFESACGKRVINRGKVLVKLVQQWKAKNPGWRHGPGRDPGRSSQPMERL